MSCEDLIRDKLDKAYEILLQKVDKDTALAVAALIEAALRDYCSCALLRKSAAKALEAILSGEAP